MKNIKVKVASLPKDAHSEIKKCMGTISRFRTLNKLKFEVLICVDYKLESPGIHYDELPDRIYVNPAKCQRLKSGNRRTCASGYVNSYTIYDVLLHEFGHFLDHKYDILKKYITEFGNNRCKINDNCSTNSMEEIAELLNVFIVNPMLLKLIDKRRWLFFKRIFKSPTATSKIKFIEFWKSWSKDIRDNCARTLKIHVTRGRIYWPCGAF